MADDHVVPADFEISATATRVPVAHGHLVSISVTLSRAVSPEEAVDVLRSFRGAVESRDLPSAPERPLEVVSEADRPQPRLDRDRGGGMTVTVGRVRRCEVGHIKFLALAHNLERGAAGAALLNAELCHRSGLTTRENEPQPMASSQATSVTAGGGGEA